MKKNIQNLISATLFALSMPVALSAQIKKDSGTEKGQEKNTKKKDIEKNKAGSKLDTLAQADIESNSNFRTTTPGPGRYSGVSKSQPAKVDVKKTAEKVKQNK